MKIIGGGRRCGKTIELIKQSHKTGHYIVCSSHSKAQHISQLARHLKLDIPYPVSVSDLPLYSLFIKEVLVDDIEDLLSVIIKKPIAMATTSYALEERQ